MYNRVSFYCHAKDASVLKLRPTQIIPREMLKQLENMTLFWENSSPKKLLLVLYYCWYRDFAWEVTPIIRDNTAASIHTITYEWWWSCGVVTVYVQCGDHNGSFKGTACFRENMNRGAPLGLVLDLCYVWIKTITTSPRKTKNKITEREISTIANPL